MKTNRRFVLGHLQRCRKDPGQPVKVAVLTNVVPTYRAGFYETVFRSSPHVDVFVERCNSYHGLQTIHAEHERNIHEFSRVSLFDSRLVWQRFPFRRILRNYDVIVSDGNLRHVSQALFVCLARFLKKRVIIWTSITHPGGAFGKKVVVTYWRLFREFLVYTDSDAQILRQRGFSSKKITSVNNGLNQRQIDAIVREWDQDSLQEWQQSKGVDGRMLVVSMGRIHAGKLDVVGAALVNIKEAVPNILWVVIGDGAGREALEAHVTQLGVAENVRFLGAVFDDGALAPWLLTSKLFIHPAPVGLSIAHAFGFGLPIVIPGDGVQHGPEVVMFKEGENGLTYDFDSSADLAHSVIDLLEGEELARMSRNALTAVRETYNTDVMADRFLNAVFGAAK